MNTSEHVAFVDTETTGLDPYLHQIWEVGLIVDDEEYRWFLPVDLGRADPIALRIGGYHERHPQRYNSDELVSDSDFAHVSQFATDFAALTRGRHLVGAVISFDEERLRNLLRQNGACPEWHYHLIDVEALAVGYLRGRINADEGIMDATEREVARSLDLPWDSSRISAAIGVNPDKFDKHTALGDARWAKAIYEWIIG